MAYTGATTPLVGTTSSATLSRDVQLDVLQAFTRKTVISPLLITQTISGGATGGKFTIEGKEDVGNTGTTYTSGSQVDVTNGTQDEIIINLDRPQYEARRIDRWSAAVANYDTIAMNVRQIGSKLGALVERKAIAAVEASSLATGLVGNGNGIVVTNTAIASETTPKGKGTAICEAIYAAIAAIRKNDDFGDIYVAVSPTNYSYIVQSEQAINADFTNGNGGFDTGMVRQVGGAFILQTNDMPSTSGLQALVFTEQSAGIVKLWDVTTSIGTQQEFLDATLITAYYSNGMGALRSGSTASIKSA